MTKELFIDRGIMQSRAGLFENGELMELYVENNDLGSLNGCIFKGRIENIELSLSALFIDIGMGRNAILHAESIEELSSFRRGQEIVVQVIREASGSKGPRVTTEISLPGKHVVLLPGQKYIGISKKIEDEMLRRNMKRFLMDKVEETDGIIIRTEGKDIPFEQLYQEYTQLLVRWNKLKTQSVYLKAPVQLFDARDFYSFLLREYVTGGVNKILINNSTEAEQVRRLLELNDPSSAVTVYCDEYNFSYMDKLEQQMIGSRERTIALPSGGSIVIDKTEAFVCIDVNSGSYTGSSDSEATALNVNLMACQAIERAIRLRKLSGILLIDFIDMKQEQNRQRVIEALTEAFKDDPIGIYIYGFTKLGILETARSKKGIGLSEFVYSSTEDVDTHFELQPAFCFKAIENQCLKAQKLYKRNLFDVELQASIAVQNEKMLQQFTDLMKSNYSIELRMTKEAHRRGFLVKNG